ncbi:MAG: hypothetical protein J6K92_00595 [Oscillospiraceae bacterium]|nr:hypothetical protein [Oscillospiraceae bacterium]
MNSTELILSITAAAAAIAADIPDNAQLAVAAAAFVQLGDTLAVIAAQRDLCGDTQK